MTSPSTTTVDRERTANARAVESLLMRPAGHCVSHIHTVSSRVKRSTDKQRALIPSHK